MPRINKLTTLLGTAAMAAAIAVVGAPKEADAALVSYEFSGNECASGGLLSTGPGLANCEVNGSPVIIKLNYDDGVAGDIEDAGNFDPIAGTFDIEFTTDFSAGTWEFFPGANDPEIRYWVANGANKNLLFWQVPDDLAEPGGVCATDPFGTQACLDAAQPVTSGVFFTPTQQNLSHLTFFDTDSDGPNGQEIPEPGSIALLGLGLLGLGYAARRRKLAA